MKREDAKLGMEVLCKNCFGATYFITKLNKTTAWVEHRTGDMHMRGGKMVPLNFEYRGVKISSLRPV